MRRAENLPPALAHAEPTAGADRDELGDPLNKFEEITNYNNFYEFSTNKEAVAVEAAKFNPYPWQVEVTGLVNNPFVIDIDDIYKRYTQEERIYRLRCVEAWSMVIPWVGFPLASLLKDADPKSAAKYVKFVTVYRPEEMRGQRMNILEWPYQEGLRLDEAMHPLTILATGMYGKPLTNQQGAHSPGGAVEVRLQKHQIHRHHRAHRGDAGHDVEHGGAARIRLLRQRQPHRRSSALVAGFRAAHR